MNGSATERVRLEGGPLDGRAFDLPPHWTEIPVHDVVGRSTGAAPANRRDAKITTGVYRRIPEAERKKPDDRLRFRWEEPT